MNHLQQIILNKRVAKLTIIIIHVLLIAKILVSLIGLVGQLFLWKEDQLNTELFAGYRVILLDVKFVMHVVSIVAGVMFIIWFWRAYDSLYKLGYWLSSSKWCTLWCWFIPILNLYLPYRYMNQLFRTASEYNQEVDGVSRDHIVRFVSKWWILLLLALIIDVGLDIFPQILFYLSDSNLGYRIVLFIKLLFGVMGCLVTIRLIRNYLPLEEKLFENANSKE